ncbi:MAG TPA: sigma-70 family RNA polymerase sigma factor [Polyangiaceae bacterium]|nr:sigma-70 family RNA polymerase sigma factor [Polyangiaceae bacterium]
MLASAASEVDAGHDLLDGCVAGSAAAWRGLHQRYHRTALSVLRRLGVPAAHLEDACQEVFVDVFRYLPRFRREADFRTWLYRICLSRARVTRRRARVWSLFSRLSPQVGPDLVEQPFDEGQASRQLARTLERLSEAERVVFVLFELEGLSGQEIAEVIERPAATVFRRLHDARKRFSAALEEGL